MPHDYWYYTRQETDFDTLVDAVRLFEEWRNSNRTRNLENFFTDEHDRFNIESSRHRMYSTAQLYGLMTKTSPSYQNEQVTQVFHIIKNLDRGSVLYNKIKTEQLLKVKFWAIAEQDQDRRFNQFPIIFVFSVLKKLQDEYHIEHISVLQLRTYIGTKYNFSQLEQTVDEIVNQSENLVDNECRIINVLENLNLFIFSDDTIALNPTYIDYFQRNFIDQYPMDDLDIILQNDTDYTNFLTTVQNFNINLINPIVDSINEEQPNVISIIKKSLIVDEDDNEYIAKVDKTVINGIDDSVFENAPNQTLEFGNTGNQRAKTEPKIGKKALQNANYMCELDGNHTTFTSNSSGRNYVEAHHLIPVSKAQEIWNTYSKNIDCVENIISLCPNCHRKIHLAIWEEKQGLIEHLYELKYNQLNSVGISITLDQLKEYYQ